jgi:hypothetical protein
MSPGDADCNPCWSAISVIWLRTLAEEDEGVVVSVGGCVLDLRSKALPVLAVRDGLRRLELVVSRGESCLSIKTEVDWSPPTRLASCGTSAASRVRGMPSPSPSALHHGGPRCWINCKLCGRVSRVRAAVLESIWRRMYMGRIAISWCSSSAGIVRKAPIIHLTASSWTTCRILDNCFCCLNQNWGAIY